jgi:hypothetical protein
MRRKLLFKAGIFNQKVIYLLIITFFSISLFSQSSWINSDHKAENKMGFKQGWFMGADFGTNLFYGAITMYNNYPKPKDFKESFGRGYSVNGGKKFKYGLAAEAQLFKGTIQGSKHSPPIYDRHFTGDVLSYSINLKYNLSQLLFREKQGRKFFDRIGVFFTAGFGQVFYRSILYKQAFNGQWYIENVTGYKATGIDLAGPNSGGGVITAKSSRASSLMVPIGGKINFRLNKKTDIVLDVYYVNVFDRSMDSWYRAWTKDDKYLYTGLGICYNFDRGDDDEVPDEERMFKPGHKKRRGSSSSSNSNDTSAPTSLNTEKKGLFQRKSKKEDKDLEIKLKLYELQLKLFEMQYMLTQ